jgi:hypothetical protein
MLINDQPADEANVVADPQVSLPPAGRIEHWE